LAIFIYDYCYSRLRGHSCHAHTMRKRGFGGFLPSFEVFFFFSLFWGLESHLKSLCELLLWSKGKRRNKSTMKEKKREIFLYTIKGVCLLILLQLIHHYCGEIRNYFTLKKFALPFCDSSRCIYGQNTLAKRAFFLLHIIFH
jgi:hypothetical protein